MLNRWIEPDLLDALGELGIGCIVFPAWPGMLTDKYLHGIPEGRARRPSYSPDRLLSDEALAKIRALNEIAGRRGQTLAQMALAWTLRDPRVTSAVIGASSVAQLEDTSPRSRTSSSRTTSSPRSTATRRTAESTSGPGPGA